MNQDRKVSTPLGIGIFLIPLIFSWFTLRKGHSRFARILSFVWLVATMSFLATSGVWENRSTNETVEQIASDVAVEGGKQETIVLEDVTRIKATTPQNNEDKQKPVDVPTAKEKNIYTAAHKMLFEKSELTEERVFKIIGRKFGITADDAKEIYLKVYRFENH